MKKEAVILLCWVTMMISSMHAAAQGFTKTSAVSVKIQQSIAITEVRPMHFGTMTVKASQGGTCVVSTAGVRSRTGGVTLSNLMPQMSLATYMVTGEPGRTYSITLPSTITVTYTTSNMVINNLLAKPASGAQSHTATGTLNVAGSEQFTIGATLNVAAGQQEGLYTGTFNITVAYN